MSLEFPRGVFDKEKYSVVITGEIGQYFVSPPFNGNLTGRQAACSSTDTGNYFSSYVSCAIKYPVDTDYQTIEIPLSNKEVDKLKADYARGELLQLQRADFNSTLFMLAFIYSLIISLLLVYKFKIQHKTMKSL